MTVPPTTPLSRPWASLPPRSPPYDLRIDSWYTNTPGPSDGRYLSHIVVDTAAIYPAFQHVRDRYTGRAMKPLLIPYSTDASDHLGTINEMVPGMNLERLTRETNERMCTHTTIITLCRAGGKTDPPTRLFLSLPNLRLLRCLHRGIEVTTPDVVAFKHVHVCEGVTRYVYASRDFRDLLNTTRAPSDPHTPLWREKWRTVASLTELVVISTEVPFSILGPWLRMPGDEDPGTALRELPAGDRKEEPEAWATVLGRSHAVGVGIDAAIAARAAAGLPPLSVILVGFSGRQKNKAAYVPREEVSALRQVRFFTHDEYARRVGLNQYRLEASI